MTVAVLSPAVCGIRASDGSLAAGLRPAGRGEAPNYSASLKLKVKVLKFVRNLNLT